MIIYETWDGFTGESKYFTSRAAAHKEAESIIRENYGSPLCEQKLMDLAENGIVYDKFGLEIVAVNTVEVYDEE